MIFPASALQYSTDKLMLLEATCFPFKILNVHVRGMTAWHLGIWYFSDDFVSFKSPERGGAGGGLTSREVIRRGLGVLRRGLGVILRGLDVILSNQLLTGSTGYLRLFRFVNQTHLTNSLSCHLDMNKVFETHQTCSSRMQC
jgi:hypothetical protein